MNIIEAIHRRTSVRTFSGQPVAKEILQQLVDAGRRAPSGRNVQPIEFIVLTDPAIKTSLASITEYGHFIDTAPACIVVVSQDTQYYVEDGCAAVENILLAATGMGLGSCWVAGDKKPYVPEILHLLQAPAGYKLVAMVAIGYAVGPTEPKPKRPLDQVLHWEKF